MEKDNFKTDVMFRVERDGTILAVFPHKVQTKDGFVSCYDSVSGHNVMDYKYRKHTKKGKPEQYADLKQELESIGYDLNIVQKQSRSKYLQSYRNR